MYKNDTRTYSGSPISASGSKQACGWAQIDGNNCSPSESKEDNQKKKKITGIFVALEHELDDCRTRIPELDTTIL